MAGEWHGFVQWEGGIADAGRGACYQEALLLARKLAAELSPQGHVSIGATIQALDTIDPRQQADIGRVLSGRGGTQEATTRVDVQLMRARTRLRRLRKRPRA